MARYNYWQQLKALLLRNIRQRNREKARTFQEVLYPITLILILTMVRRIVMPAKLPAITDMATTNITKSQFIPTSLRNRPILVVSENTADIRRILDSVVATLNVTARPGYVFVTNNTEAEVDYMMNYTSWYAGLNFTIDGDTISYSIRLPAEQFSLTSQILPFASAADCHDGPSGLSKGNCPSNDFLYSGFAVLQVAIDTAIIQWKSNETIPKQRYQVKMMPKDAHYPSIQVLQILYSIYIPMSYTPFLTYLVVYLVYDKERKIKETMQIMGLLNSPYWLSWLIVYAIVILLVTAGIALIGYLFKVFMYSNWLLIALFLYLYGLTLIAMGFLISAFSNKTRVAASVSSFIVLALSLVGYLPVALSRTVGADGIPESSYSPAEQWLLCLLSPTAIAFATDRIALLDMLHGGATLDKMSLGTFPLYGPFIMLIIDFVIYFLLAIYFDNVLPSKIMKICYRKFQASDYRPSQPPWFCFLPSYWCPSGREADERTHILGDQTHANSSATNHNNLLDANVEAVPQELIGKESIRIVNLTKAFKTWFGRVNAMAVDGFNTDVYEGHITCFLGHNGAGKTTLINMLTGLTTPTSGSATVCGHSITNPIEMLEIRGMTGLCPQQNCLLYNLTVHEHLELYANLKNVPPEKVKTEVQQILMDMDLVEQANQLIPTLSGGQKRKLSVGIALIGDPKIIFLDEPSAGMDPYSRRQLWNVLKARRPGRTIILTTHFMDEADILADRKIFMNKGKLQCCGTSLFLKNKFGVGYHLNLVLENPDYSESIEAVVKQHIPSSFVTRQHGKELSILLPLPESSRFAGLFAVIESRDMSIEHYGISMTTLEEVFLKLEDDENPDLMAQGHMPDHVCIPKSRSAERMELLQLHNSHIDFRPSAIDIVQEMDSAVDMKPVSVPKQRFWALCRIHYKQASRNKTLLWSRLIFPVAFVIIGLVIGTRVVIPKPKVPQVIPFKHILYTTAQSMVYTSEDNSAAVRTFLDNIRQQGVNLEQINASTNLLDIAPHHLGLQIGTFNQVVHNLTLLYNDTAVYSVPVLLNLISNGFVKTLAPVTIETSMFLWPAIDPNLIPPTMYSHTLFLGIALSMLPANFAGDIVKDKQLKARNQLRVSGIRMLVYWGSMFFVHIVQYSFCAILSIMVMLMFYMPSIMYLGAVVSLITLYLVYMPMVTLLSYVFSFAFKTFDSALSVIPTVYFFAAFIPYMSISLINARDSELAFVIHNVLCFVDPIYTIYGGLYYIDQMYFLRRQKAGSSPDIPIGDYFNWESGIPPTLISPFFHIIWLVVLLYYLDKRATADLHGNVCSTEPVVTMEIAHQVAPPDEDANVAAERRRVEQLDMKHTDQPPAVVAKNLRREFIKEVKGMSCFNKSDVQTKVAVNNSSFAIESGEIFGLLGPNGAGKTSTINMIISEITPSNGKVYLGGYDITSNQSEAFQNTGVCPQHDPLWEEITLKEHLECYAAIKGLNKAEVANATKEFLDELKIEEYAKKSVKKLSGGTKRKLCYAISMLGNPKVVLLDEPSAGLDPKAKRFLWDHISRNCSEKERGALLTTHNMDEADILCSRIAIMTNGSLQCIGSNQHLKSKFGQGYILEFKVVEHLDEAQMKSVVQFVKELFPDCTCLETFGHHSVYKIPKHNVNSFARIFATMEAGKDTHHITEYSFSQSTLEQVFLEFAKHQEPEDIS
ncbi:cholesterol transporter ABCA5-like [Tubulanus polymorphus]|uniref:cholesterol transporter ABCA5-like n=1 Tax=Tubulanus polymorphus TaxID=672921 RepID=UPI003DA67C8F